MPGAGSPVRSRAWAPAGQPVVLADLVYDSFVEQEKAESGGDLLVHYAVPLIDRTDVYMEFKSGAYRSCIPPGSGMPVPCGADAWGTQVWNVKKLVWRGSSLVEAWNFASDWKPEPAGGPISNFEPVFHPALAGAFVYVPGAGGTVFKVSRADGTPAARINPFGASLDGNIFVAGGLAADSAGNVLYNAIRLDPAQPWGADVAGAWLVKITPEGTPAIVPYSVLVPDAPAASADCQQSFLTAFPWPPSVNAIAPSSPCGSQRPGINVIPAIAPDGTVYTVSRAHFNSRYGYLVAVHPDLTLNWAASLRGILADGCGVGLPPNGTPGGCRDSTRPGVDPATNDLPAGRVSDFASSSPLVLPDGGVLYGAFSSYNYARGHLFKFGADGRALATYDFGWDLTPAVRLHDGTYSILVKDNHYETGSYCGDPTWCPAQRGKYDLTSLDPNLAVEWKFTNTNTLSCHREGGEISCVSDRLDGFDWCVNQPAVDANGTVWATSEDGFLYAVGRDGTLVASVFLDVALGAAYTPVAVSPGGLVYAQNNGHLFAVGSPFRASPAPVSRDRRTRAVKPR